MILYYGGGDWGRPCAPSLAVSEDARRPGAHTAVPERNFQAVGLPDEVKYGDILIFGCAFYFSFFPCDFGKGILLFGILQKAQQCIV